MNKLLAASFLLLVLAGCTPPMPSWACDDDGTKHPFCDTSDTTKDEQDSA